MLYPLPWAAETKFLGRSNDPQLGQGEGQTGFLGVSFPWGRGDKGAPDYSNRLITDGFDVGLQPAEFLYTHPKRL